MLFNGIEQRRYRMIVVLLGVVLVATSCGTKVIEGETEPSGPGPGGPGGPGGGRQPGGQFSIQQGHRICGPVRWDNGEFIIKKKFSNTDYVLSSELASLQNYFQTPVPSTAGYEFCVTGNESGFATSGRTLKVLGMENDSSIPTYQYKYCGEIYYIGLGGCTVKIDVIPGTSYCISSTNQGVNSAIQQIPQGPKYDGCVYGNAAPGSSMHGPVFGVDAFNMLE